MLSVEASRMRLDDSDHRNQCTDAATSGGREITRVTSKDRVSRMLSLEGRIVAINAPLGLGRDWVEARFSILVSDILWKH
jgi:hypothetical protein